MTELDKKYNKLADKYDSLVLEYDRQVAENKRLKTRIEKMKCCENCKYLGLEVYNKEPCCSCNSKNNKWELAE